MRSLDHLKGDYWLDKNIAEVAWFLVTGKNQIIPLMHTLGAVESLQIAHDAEWLKVLDRLIRMTFIKTGELNHNNRLTKFTRSSLLTYLRKSDVWTLVHEDARRWLMGKKILKEPEDAFERAWLKVNRQMREKAQLGEKKRKNSGLISPEFLSREADVYYLDQLRKIDHQFSKVTGPAAMKQDLRIIKHLSKEIVSEIVDSKLTATPKKLSHLFLPNGRTPTERYVTKKLIGLLAYM